MNDYEFVLHGNWRLFISVCRLSSQQWTGSRKKENCYAVKNITKAEKITVQYQYQETIWDEKRCYSRHIVVTSNHSNWNGVLQDSRSQISPKESRQVVKKLHRLSSVQVNRDLLCLSCFKGLNLKGLLREGRHGAVKRWLARLLCTKPKLQQPWVR